MRGAARDYQAGRRDAEGRCAASSTSVKHSDDQPWKVATASAVFTGAEPTTTGVDDPQLEGRNGERGLRRARQAG
jgi:hypothetical protein